MKTVICFGDVNKQGEDITNRKAIALCLLPLHHYRPQPIDLTLGCSCLHEKETSNITLSEAITHNPIRFKSLSTNTPPKMELNGTRYFRSNFKITFR